jgi:hypothetical protein
MTINLTVDPVLIPILLILIVETYRIESRLSKLEQTVDDFLHGGQDGL